MLNKVFIKLLQNYTSDNVLIEHLWMEIENHYFQKQRYYHTLVHLEKMLEQLTEVKSQIQDWNTILFSLFYHDIIYSALKSNNEAKSAELAAKRMHQINTPNQIIELSTTQILATKKHLKSTNLDTNFFLDADLSVLGQSWEIYATYYKNVRKEFSIYPDFLYNKGRKKVLNHFLEMPRIYKTDYFYTKLEAKAKSNLKAELALIE